MWNHIPVLNKEDKKTRVFIYVVAKDFGFAPQSVPRRMHTDAVMPSNCGKLQWSGWVFAMGGSRLEKQRAKCIYE